ncbi:hypothetical protein KML24008_22200 [Alistipes onderdonkii]
MHEKVEDTPKLIWLKVYLAYLKATYQKWKRAYYLSVLKYYLALPKNYNTPLNSSTRKAN